MARMRIDSTPTSCVVWCLDCRHWSEVADDRDDARRRAAEHEASVHPDTRQVRTAARIRETRREQQRFRDVRIREDNGRHGG